MIYDVHHRTSMRYAAPVADARFNLRLKPVEWRGQEVSDYSLEIEPRPDRITEKVGPYRLNTTRLEFDTEIVDLEIASSFRVAVTPVEPANAGPTIGQLRDQALASRDLSAMSPAPYLFASRIAVDSREIGEWAARDCEPDAPVIEVVLRLAARIHDEFAYEPGATDSATAPVEAFLSRHGVCQDFAHVMIMGLRWLGVPAAYASGYLRTTPPPGEEKLVGADAMHAWVTVWCGTELGWVGIDPTNNCLARGDHIQIAMGRDYADVAPIDGTFVGAAPQTMESGVDVIAIEGAWINARSFNHMCAGHNLAII